MSGHTLPLFLITCTLAALAAAEGEVPLFPFMQADVGLMGFRTLDQRVMLAPRYRLIGAIEEGIAAYSIDGEKWGYLRDGKPLTPAIYDAAWPFAEHRGRVVKGGRTGFVDVRGVEIIPPAYDEAWDFHQGFAMVEQDGTRRFVAEDGRVALATGRSQVLDVSSGRICFRDRDGWAFMDLAGTTVLPGPYEDADSFNDGLARVKVGGRWGFINLAGTLVVAPTYDSCDSFHEGLAAVTKAGKTGFIDATGAVRIPLTFDGVDYFSSGLCMISVGRNRIQYIDKSGAVVKTDVELLNGERFRHGYAHVVGEQRDGYIDVRGHWVAEFTVGGAGGALTTADRSRRMTLLTDTELAERRRAATTPAAQLALGGAELQRAYLDSTLTAAQRGALAKEAHEWIGKAAAAGHAQAQADLGNAYIAGFKDDAFTWPVDLPQGIALLTKAAEAGNADGLASLGDCHAQGTGVAKDPAKALAFYRRAADLGCAQAFIGIAVLHEEGTGVVKSFAEAEKWYRKALGTSWDEVARDGIKRMGARP